MSKRPPYALQFAERAARTTNTWWILVGADAWRAAETWSQQSNKHRPFTVCPPGEDPAIYEWEIYRQAPAPVALVRRGEIEGDQLRRLVDCLLEAGAPRVFDLGADAVFRRVAA